MGGARGTTASQGHAGRQQISLLSFRGLKLLGLFNQGRRNMTSTNRDCGLDEGWGNSTHPGDQTDRRDKPNEEDRTHRGDVTERMGCAGRGDWHLNEEPRRVKCLTGEKETLGARKGSAQIVTTSKTPGEWEQLPTMPPCCYSSLPFSFVPGRAPSRPSTLHRIFGEHKQDDAKQVSDLQEKLTLKENLVLVS